LQKNPQLAEARFLLAKALLDGGDPTGAEVELRKAQDLNYPPDQVTPLLARTMLLLGQPDKVTKSWPRRSSPRGGYGRNAYGGGSGLSDAGQGTSLAAAYAAALAAQPGYAPALLGEARLKASQWRPARGRGAARLGTRETAETSTMRGSSRATCMACQGDAAGAMAAYRKALEVKPDYLPAQWQSSGVCWPRARSMMPANNSRR
jgi:tetratricopeptide (TPR) repeat protein